MLGERYFSARERLLACCRAIDELASSCGLDPISEEDAASRHELARPLRVVALGEVNAGKSTLLNALAGAAICPAARLPTTRRTTRYVHAQRETDDEERGGWVRAGRPLDFLRRIELIDTPGTNGDARDAVFADLGRFAAADLRLVVFPSENTWTAATWDLLAKLRDEALDRTVLIIQRADQQAPEDLRVIDGHMRELSLKQVGREVPILPVAAELALEAKVSPETARKGWSASRFGAFEDFVEQKLCGSAERRHALDWNSQAASRRLRGIEESLDRQRRAMDDDGWFLAGLEQEAGQLRAEEVEKASRTLAKARTAYEAEIKELVRYVKGRLGWGRTFLGLVFGDATASRVEARFGEGLQRWMDEFGRAEAERLLERCEAHWSEVRPRVIERMGLDPGEAVIAAGDRGAVVEDFAQELLKAGPEVLGGLRVRASLDEPLRKRAGRLKALVALALSLMIAAGGLGAAGMNAWGMNLLGGAVVVWVIAGAVAWVSRRAVALGLEERLRDSAARVEAGMHEAYVEAVCGLFARYSNGLIGVRRRLAERQAELEPLAKRWDQLYVHLKTIEQDFG